MTERYCRDCGAEVTAGDRFCSECGRELDTASGNSDGFGSASDAQHGSQQEWGATTGTAQGGQYDTQTVGEEDHQYQQRHQGDTTMAAITHVLALFTWLVGPLIVYLVTDDPFVKENAANATNWQIMFTVYMLASILLVFVLIGIPLLFILPILDLAFIVIAAIKAGNGEAWSYPLTPSIL